MKNGKNGLESLKKHFGKDFDFDIEKYLWAKTPTGGFHFLFNYPDGIEVKNATDILEGVDIRGDGGYIVVAPSTLRIEEKFVEYRWYDYGLPIADAPGWVLELLTLQKHKQQGGVDITKVMTGLGAGERDNELFRYACHLSSRGVPLDIAQAFLSVAAERCNPPFSVSSAMEKVERAYKYPRDDAKHSRRDNMLRLIEEKKNGTK